MRRFLLCLLGLMWLGLSLSYAAENEFSITGKPRWYKVRTEAEPCVVRDLATHRQLGTLKSGDTFLSFGVTDKWVTFAYMGRIAYVPTSAVEDLYPVEKGEPVWRGFGPSLEDKIKQSQKELLELASDSNRLLNPDLKKKPAPGTPGAEQGAGGQPLPGVQNYVRENLTLQRGRGRGYY